MVHCCYGSGCPYELPSGECRKHGHVSVCPIDMTDDEWEEQLAEEEYWRDFKYEAEREERLFGC